MGNVKNALMKCITIIISKIKEFLEDVITRVEEKIEVFDKFIEKEFFIPINLLLTNERN